MFTLLAYYTIEAVNSTTMEKSCTKHQTIEMATHCLQCSKQEFSNSQMRVK